MQPLPERTRVREFFAVRALCMLLIIAIAIWGAALATSRPTTTAALEPKEVRVLDDTVPPGPDRDVESTDAVLSQLKSFFNGEPVEFEQIATPRLRSELKEMRPLLPLVDFSQVRVLHRGKNSIQMQAPLVDAKTREASGDTVRMRLLSDNRDGNWKLDHIRVEKKVAHGRI